MFKKYFFLSFIFCGLFFENTQADNNTADAEPLTVASFFDELEFMDEQILDFLNRTAAHKSVAEREDAAATMCMMLARSSIFLHDKERFEEFKKMYEEHRELHRTLNVEKALKLIKNKGIDVVFKTSSSVKDIKDTHSILFRTLTILAPRCSRKERMHIVDAIFALLAQNPLFTNETHKEFAESLKRQYFSYIELPSFSHKK